MNNTYAFILILVLGIVTCLIRFLPFIVLKGKPTPSYVVYLGKVLPEASMAMLVVYCLKDTQLFVMSSVMPAVLGCLCVIVTQVFSKKTVLSVLLGTVVYMVSLHLF